MLECRADAFGGHSPRTSMPRIRSHREQVHRQPHHRRQDQPPAHRPAGGQRPAHHRGGQADRRPGHRQGHHPGRPRADRHRGRHRHRPPHLPRARPLRHEARRAARQEGHDLRGRLRRARRRAVLRRDDGQDGRRRRHGLRRLPLHGRRPAAGAADPQVRPRGVARVLVLRDCRAQLPLWRERHVLLRRLRPQHLPQRRGARTDRRADRPQLGELHADQGARGDAVVLEHGQRGERPHRARGAGHRHRPRARPRPGD